MFTDASPNDEWGISAFAQYTGKAAVEDVQAEIRSIEKKGIKVIAVFMGSDRNTETAKALGIDYSVFKDMGELVEVTTTEE